MPVYLPFLISLERIFFFFSEAFLSTNLHKLYLALNNKTGGNFKLSYTPDITHTKGFDKYGSVICSGYKLDFKLESVSIDII